MSKVILYHNGPSTCSQKVRMILELKNISYESKIIDLLNGGQHDPEYVKLNPNHVVPTLITKDGVLTESSLINEYLEDTFPEIPARSTDPLKIHQMRLWAKYVDVYHPQCGAITYGIGMRNILLMKSKEELEVELENIPDPIKRNTRRDLIENGLDAPVVIEGIKQSRVFLDKLEFELSKSEWLFNDSFGIADAAALPYIIRLEQLALGELFNVSTRPNICDWYGKIKIMEIFTKAVTDFIPEQLISVLGKFGEDQKDQVISIMEKN
jgi:glutathione S-transferase